MNVKIKNLPVIALGIILLLTAIIYSNTFFNGFVNFDDNILIYNNDSLKLPLSDLIGLYFKEQFAGHYHPLTMIMYSLEFKLFGANAMYYHIIKLVTHLINIVLVYVLFREITSEYYTALLVSVLFAVNPMNVEAVAWISALGTTLYSLFGLASVISYIYFLKKDNNKLFLLISIFFFLCSVLSKSSAIVIPLLLILISYYIRRKINKNLIFSLLPFFLLSIIFGVIALLSASSFGSLELADSDAEGVERFWLACYSVVFYIWKLFLPLDLSAIHFMPEKSNGFLPLVFYISPLIILLLILVIYRVKKIRKDLVFGSLFFLINIILVIHIIPVGNTLVAERYSYAASPGIFFILVILLKYIFQKKISFSGSVPVFIMIIAGYTAFCSVLTWNRNKVWENGVTLYADVVRKYPDKCHGYRGLGNALMERGETNKAIKFFNRSVQLRPNADAYYSRGIAWKKIKNYDYSIRDLKHAIELKPDYGKYYYERAVIFMKIKKYPQAIIEYKNAIEKGFDNFFVYYNLGNTYREIRKYEEAILMYDRTIEKNPGFSDVYNNRGITKYFMKDFVGAINDYNVTINLDNDFADAYYNRGVARYSINDTDGACDDWLIASDLGHLNAEKILKRYCK